MKKVLLLAVLLLFSIAQAAGDTAATGADKAATGATDTATKPDAVQPAAQNPKQVDDTSYQKAGKPTGEKSDPPPPPPKI